MRFSFHGLACAAAVTFASGVVRADDASSSRPKVVVTDSGDSPYVWIAPIALAGASAGAMAIANAEGMDWGRVALDSAFASIGFGVGLGVSVLLAVYGKGSADKLICGIVALTAASTLAGIGLGEAITGHDPFPKGTQWPAYGGLAVGAVFDIGMFLSIIDAKKSDAVTTLFLVLAPLVIGTASVAGFSMALPKS